MAGCSIAETSWQTGMVRKGAYLITYSKQRKKEEVRKLPTFNQASPLKRTFNY